MGEREIVNSGMNFGRQPLDLRVAQFGGPLGGGTERAGSNPGLSHGHDAFGFEDGSHGGTGLDLDSATLSAVLGNESLLSHPKSGSDVSQQTGTMDLSSLLAASIGMLPVRHSGLPLCAWPLAPPEPLGSLRLVALRCVLRESCLDCDRVE